MVDHLERPDTIQWTADKITDITAQTILTSGDGIAGNVGVVSIVQEVFSILSERVPVTNTGIGSCTVEIIGFAEVIAVEVVPSAAIVGTGVVVLHDQHLRSIRAFYLNGQVTHKGVLHKCIDAEQIIAIVQGLTVIEKVDV